MTEAFWDSVRHVSPLAVGLNCALGAKEMRPYIAEMARIADSFVSCYPNAGLPNAFGEYDEAPEETAAIVGEFAEAGLVNLVGGCCGTTPDHIAAIAKAVDGRAAARVAPIAPAMRLSGLEPFTITDDSLFVNVGERTNITGSARFRTLIKDGDYDTALSVAAQQVENGAQVIDVNMDEGMIDGVAAMDRFLKLVASEPDISRVPVMVDSSKWEVIEAGLKCVQGKADRQLDLAQGGRGGLRRAGPARAQVRRCGGRHGLRRGRPGRLPRAPHRRSARGPTGSSPRRSASRPRTSSSTPTSSPSRPASRSTRPTASTSSRRPAGSRRTSRAPRSPAASPTSRFSFRGNNPVREAIHAVFLYHAIAAGLDMGIVNAGALVVYDQVDAELRERIEDVVLNRRPDAAERLLEIAEGYNRAAEADEVSEEEWRALPVARADHARARQGHRRPRRGRHRGAARRDRRRAAAGRSRSSRVR